MSMAEPKVCYLVCGAPALDAGPSRLGIQPSVQGLLLPDQSALINQTILSKGDLLVFIRDCDTLHGTRVVLIYHLMNYLWKADFIGVMNW